MEVARSAKEGGSGGVGGGGCLLNRLCVFLLYRVLVRDETTLINFNVHTW